MNLARVIRERRKELGLDDTFVSKRSGLSIHQYADVEQHPDEFETAISAKTAMEICAVLGLNVRDVLGLPQTRSAVAQSASTVMRTARERHGLSESTLADRIGFDEDTIHSLEASPDKIYSLPLVVIFDLERELGLERGTLI